jgi:hypothetical protein
MSKNGMIIAARFDMFAAHDTRLVGRLWKMISEIVTASTIMNG